MTAASPQRRGFTFVEVLLALTISAALMAAIGSAMFAGAGSMKVNRDFTQATSTARNAVQAISAAVRTSYSCDVDAGCADVGTATGNILYVTPFNGAGGAGDKIAYVYDDVEKKLLLDTKPVNAPINGTGLAGIRARMTSTPPTVFLLADQVDSASFTGRYDLLRYAPLADWELHLVNVQITVRVGVGDSVLDLSDSVVPRTAYDQ